MWWTIRAGGRAGVTDLGHGSGKVREYMALIVASGRADLSACSGPVSVEKPLLSSKNGTTPISLVLYRALSPLRRRSHLCPLRHHRSQVYGILWLVWGSARPGYQRSDVLPLYHRGRKVNRPRRQPQALGQRMLRSLHDQAWVLRLKDDRSW